MKKPEKLIGLWLGRTISICELLGWNGFMDHDERGKICVIKGKNDQLWDRLRRDSQVPHSTWSVKIEGLNLNYKWVVTYVTNDDGMKP